MMAVVSMAEPFLKAVLFGVVIFFLLGNDLFNFKQIMLVINFNLTLLAQTKERTGWALIPYSNNRLLLAGFTFKSFMH